MFNSSIIEIFRTFQKEDLKKFEEFVDSPYFNKKSNVKKLFRIVKKFAPEYSNKKLHREVVWKNIFPGKKFNYGVMKNMIFELHKLSHRFMAISNFEQKGVEQSLFLLEELNLKDLDNLFEKNLKVCENRLKKSKINDTYFNNSFKLEVLKFNYNLIKKKIENNKDYFKNANENLWSLFLREYFIINSNFLMMKNDLKVVNIDLDFVDYIIGYINENSFKFKNIILMYYNAFMLLAKPEDESNFYNLKKLAENHSDELDEVERYNLYTLLTNYCIVQSGKGVSKFENEELELYKIILAKKAYSAYENGILSHFIYFNIARLASKLKHFDWALEFINKYRNKLPEEHKKDFYYYTLSFIEFERKNYHKSLELISTLKFYDRREKAKIRVLTLMNYYELGYTEQFLSLIDTSKHFAKNDLDLSEGYKEKFLKFIQIVLKLFQLRYLNGNDSNTNFNLSKIKNQIRENDLPNKYWLVEKLDELN